MAKSNTKSAGTGLFNIDQYAANHDNMAEKPYDVRDFYKAGGQAVRLCNNQRFENMTFAVIGINALYLGYDSDNNFAALISDAHPLFQVCENLFKIYFTFELLVRFQAFEVKSNCCRDPWFVFDTILVLLMVFETWFLPIVFGGRTLPFNIQFLRLLRLLRLARMVRLLRNLPELLALVKATGAAIRSVSTVVTLLGLVVYVFAIVFRMTLGVVPGRMEYRFGSIRRGMSTLFYRMTLLDGSPYVWDELWKTMEEDEDNDLLCQIMAVVFLLYVFFSTFTVLNMLIGVLCEVITAISAATREESLIDKVRETLFEALTSTDADDSKTIDKQEFQKFLANPLGKKLLTELDVDKEEFAKTILNLYDSGEATELSYHLFMKYCLELRKTNTARIFDVNQINRIALREMSSIKEFLEKIRTRFGHQSSNGTHPTSDVQGQNRTQNGGLTLHAKSPTGSKSHPAWGRLQKLEGKIEYLYTKFDGLESKIDRLIPPTGGD
jgi:voltage-gated sodium channel